MNKDKHFIKTAVIGHPIAHSKSPLIHEWWLREHGLSGSYDAIDIAPDALTEEVRSLVEQGYSGFNVTIPHKIAIMDLCNSIDKTARGIGAVNTVGIKDGKLYGTNTDGFGFAQNILSACKKEGWGDWHFSNGSAVVLGAGGAARAVIHALLERGVPEILLLNRTEEKAITLSKMAKKRITVVPWTQRNEACSGANLLVNTTALGMEGKPELDIDLCALPSHALVTDIVYAPLITGLLKQANALDLRIVTGIGMLLHQARPGFDLWNGIMPDVTLALEEKVLER